MTRESKDRIRFGGPAWLGLLGIVALYVLLRWNLIDIPLERDEGTFGYLGQVINDGGLPYRDAFDMKPPVTFYLYAWALRWIEPTARGVHLFAQGYNLLTLLFLVATARRFFQANGPALWSGLIFAIYTSTWSVEGFAATTEVFMLLPLTLSLGAAVLATERQGWFWVMVSGIFGALACWTKQVAAFSVLAILVYILSDTWLTSPGPVSQRLLRTFKSLVIWLLGGIAASLLPMAPFLMTETFWEFLYWVFLPGLGYTGTGGGWGPQLVRVAQWLWAGLPGDTLPLAIGLIGPWLLIGRGKRESLFVLGFLYLSFLAMVPGHQYRHYFIQLGPAVALAAGWSLHGLIASLAKPEWVAASRVLVAMLLVGLPVTAQSEYYWSASPDMIARAFFGMNPFPESFPVAEYLRKNSQPTDRIFVRGSEPQILFYANRRSATKFVLIYPLYHDSSRVAEFQTQAREDISTTNPEYIVFVKTAPSISQDTSLLWDGRAPLRFEDEIIKLLNTKYRMVAWVPVGTTKPQLNIIPLTGKEPMAQLARLPGFIAIAKRISD